MFKASSENKVGKTIFYVFEGCAGFVGLVMFILSIYYSAQLSSFVVFLEYFLNAIVNTLIIFGLGKVIDLMLAKRDEKCCNAEKESEKEEQKSSAEEEE